VPARIRRPRRTSDTQPATAPDSRTQRAVRQIVAAEKSRLLQTDQELDDAAIVTATEITRAESLWDEAQRRAGTGLDGLLSARTDPNG